MFPRRVSCACAFLFLLPQGLLEGGQCFGTSRRRAGVSWNIHELNSNLLSIDINEIITIPFGKPNKHLWAWNRKEMAFTLSNQPYRVVLAKQRRTGDHHRGGTALRSNTDEKKAPRQMRVD